MTKSTQISLCIALFVFLCSLLNVNAASCVSSKSIVHAWNITSNLILKGWTKCYSAPYSDATSSNSLLTTCQTGDNFYLFVGAKQSSSTVAYIGAYGPSQVLTAYTSSTSTAYKPTIYESDTNYVVYWYNYAGRSFGFSPTAVVKLNYPDTYGLSDNDRLSWLLDGSGGWRAGNYTGLYSNSVWQKILYYKDCSTHSPTSSPTRSAPPPTIHPTLSPTPQSQLFVLQYIDNYNVSVSCTNLVENMDLEYEGTLSQCRDSCDSKPNCKLFDYFENFKTINGTRCYIFDQLCDIQISYVSNDYKSVIGYFEFKKECLDYPYGWVDNAGDDCEYYKSYNWCKNESILRERDDFLNYIDYRYQLNAMDTCCECGGGINIMDDIAFSLDNAWVDDHDILCTWTDNDLSINLSNLRDWDNIMLYSMCKGMNGVTCDMLIDTKFNNIYYNHSLHLCEYTILDYNNMFQFMFDVVIDDKHQIYDIYVNSLWFNLDISYYSSNINIIYLKYSDCATNIIYKGYGNESQHYGAHPCHVIDTLSAETLEPTSETFPSQQIYPAELYDIQHIQSNANASCHNLPENSDIKYDVSLSQCQNWCNDTYDCKVFNFFNHFKAVNHSRCYIFDELCKIKIDDGYQSVIGYYEFIKDCQDYPTNWTDNVDDGCVWYESFNWCHNNSILRDENDFYNYIDQTYKFSAIDTCCSCGGGITVMDNVALSLDSNWVDVEDDILCQWIPSAFISSKHYLRRWDNMVLYNLCLELEQMDCNFLINILFDAGDTIYSLHVCDYYTLNQQYSVFEFIFDIVENYKAQEFDIYVNTLWFELNLLLYSSKINIIQSNYSNCSRNIRNANKTVTKHYGVHPCYALDTLYIPTNIPTNIPTSTTNIPTNIPTNYPTTPPTQATIAPSSHPTTPAPTNIPSYPTITIPPTKATTPPTNIPTNYPNYPTTPPTQATIAPSSHPTTPAPTNIPSYPTTPPTNIPSYPTNYPSHNPINPTSVPTNDPVTSTSIINILVEKSTTIQQATLTVHEKQENHMKSIVIILSLILCVFVIILLFLIYKKIKKDNAATSAQIGIEIEQVLEKKEYKDVTARRLSAAVDEEEVKEEEEEEQKEEEEKESEVATDTTERTPYL